MKPMPCNLQKYTKARGQGQGSCPIEEDAGWHPKDSAKVSGLGRLPGVIGWPNEAVVIRPLLSLVPSSAYVALARNRLDRARG